MFRKFILLVLAFVCTFIIILFIVNLLEPKIKIYNSDYTKEEIKFAEENIYPKAKTPTDLLRIYTEAVKNKDKQTTKLLSSPEFATIPSEMWNEKFDKFWEKYKGSEISYSQKIEFNEKLGCNAIFISFKNEKFKNQFVCVNSNFYQKSNMFSSERIEYFTLSLLQ